MDVVYSHCCGLDVHKKNVVACVLTPEGKEIRTFATLTDDLLQLIDWLKNKKCTVVAMESTASFWKPIFNLLELEEIQPLVVNAQHIRNVPGRKTDVKDAEWIASLLRHGLLKGSYIPTREHRELRELIRYRRSLIEERSREANRIQKVLEGANIKLSSVIRDVLGKSGRAMLDAMIAGEEDPVVLSEFAQKRMKSKKAELQRALHGLMGPHQKQMLQIQLRHIDFLEAEILTLNAEVKARMSPFEEDLERLDTIPGVGRSTAEHIVTEAGVNVQEQFGSAARLCAWAGLAPGQNESAGKQKNAKTRKGNSKLRSALIEAARAAARTQDTYLSNMYKRLAARRGANRAAVAVAHRILFIAYHLLTKQQDYKELGSNYFEERQREHSIRRSVKRLEALGCKVTLESVG
ncbi:IS110 family transposase [Paenibacillus sonchi]|uniref:IS110 family transposase n=1 Tax=Paenibacillus sonchi TaxID=373687 RepID=A0A974PGG6_9BACL|nr:IS110 family transposase [Paenibacillus sonchi]MCE3198836.1 IS110 family transposase [Paenibacillus sonchi]MCE3198844.1 IS110 family transposase [Paenibacillus sonchi]MCE3199789.1 IS110 family transposase [Paenibacillus sonchi]MCE3201109.1 IS110 family transposase [Paenibacillus sonchi]QQZ63335.1 IS110 family transposase [Paenibacillus sonchi]